MMSPTVRRLRAAARRGEAPLLRFLEKHGVPIQGEGLTTFVFVGEADRVDLDHWIYGLPGTQPFDRVTGTNVWHLSMDLPAESRIEYKLGVTRNGHRETILDPLNPRRAHDPFGANSVCSTEGYRTPEWAGADPDSRPGSMEHLEIDSTALGSRRTVLVYLPARFRPGRKYPLLMVHDGSDYLRYSSLQHVLDNLITRLEVAPLIVALTDPGNRLKEYAADTRHARHITEEVLPLLADRYPLVDEPGGRGLDGGQPRRGRLALHRLDVPGDMGPAHAPVGIVRIHRHREDEARPHVRAGSHLDEPVPVRPGATRRPGICELWRIRITDL